MKTVVVALALAAGMLAMVIVLRGGVDLREHSEKGEVTVKATTKRVATDSAGSLVAAIPPMPVKPAAAVKTSRQSSLMAEMSRARNYKEIYDRLAAKADRTPEENYALAEILARCGKNISQVGFTFRQRLGGDDRRKQFVDALSEKDPLRERRIAAFDEINHDPCTGLEGLSATQADVRAMIAAAAAAGDPKARATQVMQEMVESRRSDSKGPPRPMSISDAQLDTLRSVLASDDPEAVMTATRALLMPVGNLTVRAGPGESTLDGNAFTHAAHFLACDLGYPCGREAPEVTFSCAMSGNCAAADYREHAYFYNLSPASVQTMQQYYEQLQRARAGDWSYFTFFRGQSPRAAIQNPPKK